MTRLRPYQALLLIGPPGSGKSTQGKVLGMLPGFHYWEAGEALRAIDPDSEVGRVIHHHSAQGELIPDELAVSLCLDDLKARVAAGAYHPENDILVLDGIPRSVKQAALLEAQVAVIKILHLVCSDVEQLVQRLRRRAVEQGRTDDAKERVIRHRLAVYQQTTAQVLTYYPTEYIAPIDALRSPAEVLDQILHVLIPLLNRRHARQAPQP
jgi:adenylate kinase